jgi:hypothetical protein
MGASGRQSADREGRGLEQRVADSQSSADNDVRLDHERGCRTGVMVVPSVRGQVPDHADHRRNRNQQPLQPLVGEVVQANHRKETRHERHRTVQ